MHQSAVGTGGRRSYWCYHSIAQQFSGLFRIKQEKWKRKSVTMTSLDAVNIERNVKGDTFMKNVRIFPHAKA